MVFRQIEVFFFYSIEMFGPVGLWPVCTKKGKQIFDEKYVRKLQKSFARVRVTKKHNVSEIQVMNISENLIWIPYIIQR